MSFNIEVLGNNQCSSSCYSAVVKVKWGLRLKGPGFESCYQLSFSEIKHSNISA